MLKKIIQSKKSLARICMVETAHGTLETPFFMPDATYGVVKHLSVEELEKIGVPAMVVNTYHLYLNPGVDRIKKIGGIHKLMAYKKPLLSDSGGFQIFSLIHKNNFKSGKILADKVIFSSPLDGSRHELTPEKSIQIQFDLGTDMVVCLDDCRPNDVDQQQASAAVKRTVAWAKLCKQEYDRQIKKRHLKGKFKPLLFGVVQGGIFPTLRQECAASLATIGFDGLGYGARPVDEKGIFLADVLNTTAVNIPDNYLKFALGVGTPEDILRCVKLGWDMFDCVIPTREGRHGRLYQFSDCVSSKNFYNVLNINGAQFKNNLEPINKKSALPELQIYSKAYLHHLFKIKEPLAQRLATLNNLEFYTNLLQQIKTNIRSSKI